MFFAAGSPSSAELDSCIECSISIAFTRANYNHNQSHSLALSINASNYWTISENYRNFVLLWLKLTT